ncbi:MAG: hypothetical protein KDD82_01370 [Planctomycetes bacterium]|nr:hypothetical protein [Planctomycetota bacterium]
MAAALLVAELAVRVAGVTAEPKRHFSPGIFRPDPELGWALAPSYSGTYRGYSEVEPLTLNAAGFRGSAWEPRASAALRVVALGDSCTFGLGVADDAAYPAQLEALLRGAGRDAAVFNLGVPGYDTRQEAALWDRLAPRLAPQAVVLGWLPNDAKDLGAPARLQVLDGYLVRDAAQLREWRARIEHRGLYASALYRVLGLRVKQLKGALGLQRQSAWRPERIDADALAPSLEALTRIQARCAAIGARLVVVLFPRRDEVERPLSRLHYDLVRAHLEGLGASVIDLPHAWRERPPAGELYLLRDTTHLTARGYADVARRVADELLAH